MSLDVVDLRNFYSQGLGIVAPPLHRPRHPRALAGCCTDYRLAGIGYATPYLGLFREDGRALPRLHAGGAGRDEMADRAARRSRRWSEDTELPLTDSAIDRVLLVHALEMTDDAIALLREAWRVLSPNGRLLPVIPNRRGSVGAHRHDAVRLRAALFARADHAACCARPGSRRIGWGEALYVPPIARGWFLRTAVAWERDRIDDLGAVRRRAYRGSDQAGLSRDPGAARKARAGARPRAGAGAVDRRRCAANSKSNPI